MAVDPKTLGATTEQESMERFGTPLPTADPASQQGVRQDQYYIGPTNFAKLQQQYSPYQIEQATRRDKRGNIFWNPEVNIADIPKAPPPAELKAPSQIETPSAAALSSAGLAGEVPTQSNAMLDVSRSISSAAQNFLSNTVAKTVDTLQGQLQEAINAEKEAAQKQRDAATQELDAISKEKFAQEALEAARKKFEVDRVIGQYNQISQNIVDAQAALDQGLVYEQSRPVRMALVSGRANQLRQQGLAMIGTMQATASMLKGQLDLARAYADDTIEAINMDNNRRINALNTLIDLSQNDIVRLDRQEKDIIEARIASIQAEAERINQNKDSVLELMSSSPSAALQGKVLITDSPEQAIEKMLPFLAAQEQAEFDLAVQKASGRGGARGRGGAGVPAGGGEQPSDFNAWLENLNSTQKRDLNEMVSGALQADSREEALQWLSDNESLIFTQFGDTGLRYIASWIDRQYGVPTEPTEEELAAEIEAAGERPPLDLTPAGVGRAFSGATQATGSFLGRSFELSPLGFASRLITGKGLTTAQQEKTNQAAEFLNGLLGG